MTQYVPLAGPRYLSVRNNGSVARLTRSAYRALGTPPRVSCLVSEDRRRLLIVPDPDGAVVNATTGNFGAAKLVHLLRPRGTTRYPVTITEHKGRPAALVTLKELAR